MKTSLGYTIEAFPEIPSFMDTVTRQLMDLKESIFKQIIEQVTGRPPVPEDAKDFTFVAKDGVFDKEIITYKGRPIGALTQYWKCGERHTAGYRFDPDIKTF